MNSSATVECNALDPDAFRDVLGHLPTGVCVVCGIDRDGEPVGLSVGSFTSVSLDPPLVGFLPAKSSTSWPRIAPTGRFCANVLSADQEDVCRRLAERGSDKFAGLSWRPAMSGSPILDGAVAWADCEITAVHEAGDHFFVVARVLALSADRGSEPLVFHRGGYGRVVPLALEG